MSSNDSNNITQLFGDKLYKLRLAKKLTLQQMAIKLGLTSHSYLSELESGKKKPSIDLVLKISRTFNMSTDYLLKDEIEIEENYL
ncbi:MAG: helix-turn-helix transcriptional regulator [Acidobacteria bacterium]|nr:helix-turn-helix transcriptional regulator [Acidobacteriota bacterium]